MKTQTKQIIVATFGIGMILGTGLAAFLQRKLPVRLPLPTSELQLIEYKKAEVVCGVGNVIEKQFTFNRRGDDPITKSTDEFLCDDLEFAALSEASRSAIHQENMQKRVDRYCEYTNRVLDPSPFANY